MLKETTAIKIVITEQEGITPPVRDQKMIISALLLLQVAHRKLNNLIVFHFSLL